jgi:hypothetical protein
MENLGIVLLPRNEFKGAHKANHQQRNWNFKLVRGALQKLFSSSSLFITLPLDPGK